MTMYLEMLAVCILGYLGMCDGFSPVSPGCGLFLRKTLQTREFATSMDRTRNVLLAAQLGGSARKVSCCMSESNDEEAKGEGFPFLESNAGEGVFKFQILAEATKRFNDAIGTDNPEQVFLESDGDGSGGLDFDEWSAAFGGLGMGLGYTSMRQLFDDVDLDGDGIVSLSEFKTRMETDLAEAQKVATAAAAAAVAAELDVASSPDPHSDVLRLRLEEVRRQLKAAESRADEISFAIASIP
mmetsp:Transcript_70480/g.103293  ORF Transcript_70480/g.103293 Transcript_70480/m.103293 type:complete len:241 (+) Transcript_70480:37-759(+)